MNFSELLSNPSMMHAAVVHMPIAATVLGLSFIVLSAIFHRNNTLRVVALLLFAIAATSAWVGIETGENARDLVPNTMSDAIWDQISAHAKSAERVMYAALFTFVCLAISLIRVDFLRIAGLLIAAVGALVANVFVAQTGHMGGALVYNEGVGTPLVHQKAETPAAEIPVVEPPMDEAEPTNTEAPEMVPVEEAPAPEATPEPEEEAVELIPIRDFTMEEAKQVSYIRDVWPLLDDQCAACHESPDPDGDYDIMTVENMMKAGKKGGPGVIPGEPDESSIIKYIRGSVRPRMPEDEPPLSEDQVHMLRMWIAAGAVDDSKAVVDTAPEPPAAEVVMEDAAPAEVPAPEAAAAEEAAPVPAPAEEVMEEEAPAEVSVPEVDPNAVPAPEATPEVAPTEEPMEEVAPAAEVPTPELVPEEVPTPEAAPEAPAASQV